MKSIVTQFGERSEDQGEFAKALSCLQGKIKALARNSIGEHGKFSDLNAVYDVIQKPMHECGLSVYQFPHDTGEGFIALETTILHVSGQFRTGYKRIHVSGAGDADQGGAVGYWSRICLTKALGLWSESAGIETNDSDDGGSNAERGAFDYKLLKGTQKTWFDRAVKALEAPNADRQKIMIGVSDSVDSGKMTNAMLEELRSRFPAPSKKEKENAK